MCRELWPVQPCCWWPHLWCQSPRVKGPFSFVKHSLAESINMYFELGDQSVICDEPCTKRASPGMCSEGTMSL